MDQMHILFGSILIAKLGVSRISWYTSEFYFSWSRCRHKHFGPCCSGMSSWLKINGSWEIKSLQEKFLRTWKQNLRYLSYLVIKFLKLALFGSFQHCFVSGLLVCSACNGFMSSSSLAVYGFPRWLQAINLCGQTT